MRRLLVVLSVFGLVAAACTAGGGEETPATIPPGESPEPVTIEIWGEWSSELKKFNKIFPAFEEKYPWITVKSIGNIDSDKLLAAISSGTVPDVALSFSFDEIGKFCSTGAWADLTPYIQQSNFDLSQFPQSVFKYTSFAGSQCSLPFLTDAYGLYYSKDMFEKAGITEPPKTLSELTADAKKLTEFNPDGSIKVAGFVPWVGYYEYDALHPSIPAGAHWYNEEGTESVVATDPAWKDLLTWQKELVDWYGADNLAKFVAGQGNEWGAAQDFMTGKVAMTIDGEWRTAFIADLAPDLNYGTAPFPVPDDKADSYGMGEVGGTIIGIPKGSPHPAEAWLLVSWMATDTPSLVYMANFVRNVPTTYAALESPDLDAPPEFQTFLDIFANPLSHEKETSTIGSADQDLMAAFIQKWQSGKVTDLQAGLEQVGKQIDALLAEAAAP